MTYNEIINLEIPSYDRGIYNAARKNWDSIAHPLDGLGVLEEDICRIAAAGGCIIPDISKKALVIMCADNGIVEEGVSQCGCEVTAQVAELMGKRKSSVGIMTEGYPLDIVTVDIGIASEDTQEGVMNRKVLRGTKNFLKAPAMSEEECLKAIETGMDIVEGLSSKGCGIIATGEMGIGNTTTSTALLCSLCGLKPETVTGRGAGLSDDGLKKKISVIEKGIRYHKLDGISGSLSKQSAFKALCCVGGLDIAGLTGVFIGGALHGIPVVIDGLISSVAALCAESIAPGCKNNMLASHCGKEKGCRPVLDKLGLKSAIDADLALGEGSGAVMLFPLLDMALSLYKSGTAFTNTDIEKYTRFDQ